MRTRSSGSSGFSAADKGGGGDSKFVRPVNPPVGGSLPSPQQQSRINGSSGTGPSEGCKISPSPPVAMQEDSSEIN